jgi:hypothetical protein
MMKGNVSPCYGIGLLLPNFAGKIEIRSRSLQNFKSEFLPFG